MKRLFSVFMIACLALPLTLGCEKKAEVKKETTVSTPDGTTTTTDSTKVETSGENPPPAQK